MSAYVVTRETINCCCAAYAARHKRIRGNMPEAAELSRFGRMLWEMNTKAVSQRYSEEPERVGRFDYRPAAYSPVQQSKSLHCLQYQCSEGDVPDSAEFKLLAELVAFTDYAIVSDLPEYDRAQWGLRDPQPQATTSKPASKPASKPQPAAYIPASAISLDY